jgi:HD-like signal output (HDOD) protein
MSLWTVLREWLAQPAWAPPKCASPTAAAASAAGASTGRLGRPAADVSAAPPDAWWIPRGQPVIELPAANARPLDQAIHAQLSRALDDPHLQLPALPRVAQQALVLLRDDSVNFKALADLIGQDAVLAAEVLRLANSVAYRGLSEIRRLDVAFARVGQRALRALILSVGVKNSVAIRTGGAERTLGEELWQRALASSVLMGGLSRRFGLGEDDAVLAGLLHDIGMLAILKIVHERQQRSACRVTRPEFDAIALQWHEHIGMRLADSWNLPDPLPELIGNHHRLPSPDDRLKIPRLLLQLSDVICAMHGFSPYVPYDFFNVPCVAELGLRDDAETRALLLEIDGWLTDRLEK